jgi:hypothetical protein
MTIRNTTRETQENPLGFLAGAMGGDPSAPILAQEAQGQREVVNSTAIPTDMHCKAEDLEALGFVLGEIHKDDPMFREATLPEGWQREGSDHAMWSYIVDERGFRRVSIFYKAAFYDRSAHIGIQHQPTTKAQDDSYEAFNAWCPYNEGWSTDTRKDGDNLIRRARLVKTEDGRKVYDHDAGEWAFTGKVRERVVAPDGSIIEDRESEAS